MDTSKHTVTIPVSDYNEMISKLSIRSDSDILVNVLLKTLFDNVSHSEHSHLSVSDFIYRIRQDLAKVGYKFTADSGYRRFSLEKLESEENGR